MQKIKKQWFLLGLILVFGSVVFDGTDTLAGLGKAMKANHFPEIMIVLIFIFSGLMIEIHQVRAGVKDLKATLSALSVIILFAPVAAWGLSFLPLETGVLVGLFIVSVMPTTLSSGVVMTGAAGGNMAHALFVTVLSNSIGIITIPFILSILLSFLSQGKAMSIDQRAILVKLILLVLLPLLIGMAAKAFLISADFLRRFKLQILNQCMILLIVFISVSGAKEVLVGNSSAFFPIVGLVATFHVILLGCSFLLVTIFNIEKGRRESIIFMGSQKTLPLAAMIQVTYFGEFGTALLVCVVHHIVHLMIDGYLSARMNPGASA